MSRFESNCLLMFNEFQIAASLKVDEAFYSADRFNATVRYMDGKRYRIEIVPIDDSEQASVDMVGER